MFYRFTRPRIKRATFTLLAACLFAVKPLHSQTVIAFQGFEGSPSDNWSWVPPAQSPQAPQVWVGVNNYGFGFAFSGNNSVRAGGGSTSCGSGSSNCVNGQPSGGSCTNNPNGTIVEFLPVNVGCYDQLSFKIHYRTHFLCSGEGEGFDGTDSLFFEVSLNGGPWFAADTLKGSNNHIWTYSTPVAGIGLTAPNPWTYNVPAGTMTFAFRTRAVVNRTDEVYYVDHAELKGMPAVINPAWTAPDSLCSSSGPLLLDSLLLPAATPGGNWTGAGVSGNMFDPAGLSGIIILTYTAGMPPCDSSLSRTIYITPSGNASWNPPPFLCSGFYTDLNQFLDSLATTGGTWSGPQISGSMLNTTGLSGTITVSYQAGTIPCQQTQTAGILIVSAPVASFLAPDTLCSNSGLQNLSSWLLPSSTPGGIWMGPQVSSGWFDPSGITGSVSITYDVSSGNCDTSETHTVFIKPAAVAAWTAPPSICAAGGILDLNLLTDSLTTPGGQWSGTGVNGHFFNPAGLYGYYPLTYAAGAGNCADTVTQFIHVVQAANPSWTSPGWVCSDAANINLNTLLNPGATPGGQWSGTGVSGSLFYPAGLNGNVSITYIAGVPGCDSSETHTITVLAVPWAAVAAPDSLCSGNQSIDPNGFLAPGSVTTGYWSGPGIFGDSLYLQGLSGTVSLLYHYGSTPCERTLLYSFVAIQTPVAAISGDTAVCDGEQAVLTASGGNQYLWNNGSTSAVLQLTPAAPANYTVTVFNGPCHNTASSFLNLHPRPNVLTDNIRITPETCSDANGMITGLVYAGTEPFTILWQSDFGFSSGEPEGISGLASGTYLLTLKDFYCSNSISFEVPRDESLCETVYIPNIFSPDNDGVNDIFTVRGKYISEVSLSIYDRWGKKIFESSSYGWNGKANGQEAEAGVYTYMAVVTFQNGKIIRKSGNISLVR